jgi:hypothetical protein
MDVIFVCFGVLTILGPGEHTNIGTYAKMLLFSITPTRYMHHKKVCFFF